MARQYRYLARSRTAFIAQVVRYISKGYFFYVVCQIPERKNPVDIDAKLLERYSVKQPRWRREKRNLKDSAAVHYLRFGQMFVLMLTKGRHDAFYEDHAASVRDIRRRNALVVFDYSIRYTFSEFEKRYRTFVRLDQKTYAKLKADLIARAGWSCYRERERMEREFFLLPYESYGPVIEQLQTIRTAVNRVRRTRGFDYVRPEAIRRKLNLMKVFVEEEEQGRGVEAA